MEAFIKEYYSLFTHGIEILAAVTGLIVFKKYKHTTVRYFIYFLVYVALIEIIGTYPRYLNKLAFLENFNIDIKNSLFRNNYWWYTLFWTIGSVLFYLFYYYKVLKNKTFKQVLKYGSFLFLIIAIISIIVKPELFFNFGYASIRVTGLILVLLCVLFYFVETLNSDKILTFHNSFNFFVSSAILVWWLLTVPLTFYGEYYNLADMQFVLLRMEILLFSNIFMYGIFTFAFIWSNPLND